ncbi:hypothetical protein ACFVOK_22130 [Streptomyces sp. NPDC057798]|uniref:hypothetical protein n=1 Tax=Streptomyces sp. NPDC057798 TaxID=3346252 RepID=UPI0036884CF8
MRGERETVWLRRLRVVTQGGDLRRWRIVGRNVVTFPEVLAVADALTDSATAELAWLASGPGRGRSPPTGPFGRRLGERVPPTLGPERAKQTARWDVVRPPIAVLHRP